MKPDPKIEEVSNLLNPDKEAVKEGEERKQNQLMPFGRMADRS